MNPPRNSRSQQWQCCRIGKGTALAVLLRPRLNPAALAAEVRLTIQADCEQDPALTSPSIIPRIVTFPKMT